MNQQPTSYVLAALGCLPVLVFATTPAITDIAKPLTPGMRTGLRSPVKDARRKFALAAMLFLAVVGGLSTLLARDALAAEAVCARGDILMCEDFQWSTDPNYVATAADWRAHGWDPSDSDKAAYPNDNVFCNNIFPHSTGFLTTSNCAYQVQLNASPSDGTFFPNHAISDIPVNGSWVYARMYIKWSTGYVFMRTNEQKLAYFRSDSGTLVWRVELQHTATDDTRTVGKWQIDPSPPHVQIYNCNQIGVNCTIQTNRWYSVEFGVRTPTSSADNNGALRVWVDGVLMISQENIVITGGNTTPINGVWLCQYYGGNPGDNRPQQWIWIDNIVVSTNYIGPIGSRPPAPSNLRSQ